MELWTVLVVGSVLYAAFQAWKVWVMWRAMRVWSPVAGPWREVALEELAEGLRARLGAAEAAVRAVGFEPSARVHRLMDGGGHNSMTITECVSDAEPGIRAYVTVAGLRMLGSSVVHHSFEFTSRLAGGRSVTASNTGGFNDLSSEGSTTERFVRLRDPAVLLEAHRRLVVRAGGPGRFEEGGVRAMNKGWERSVERMRLMGRAEVSVDGARFRWSMRSALAEALQMVGFVSALKVRKVRRRSEELLRELGFGEGEVMAAEGFRLPGETRPGPAR